MNPFKLVSLFVFGIRFTTLDMPPKYCELMNCSFEVNNDLVTIMSRFEWENFNKGKNF